MIRTFISFGLLKKETTTRIRRTENPVPHKRLHFVQQRI